MSNFSIIRDIVIIIQGIIYSGNIIVIKEFHVEQSKNLI